MEPLVVDVVRGDVVEARHRVHAAVVRDGRIELAIGDPGLVSYLRSSAKPIQSLPVIRACPDLDEEEIVLLCASHLARPEQLAIVRRVLAGAGATAADLECGPDPTPIEHNCSGKHAGFIALCRARGWPVEGYRLASHPCQQAMRDEIAAAADVAPSLLVVAIDGCGVLTFGMTLERAALAFSRLPSLEGASRAIDAMRAYPELLRGPVAADVVVNRTLDGWVAKGGAEGLFCASGPAGVGLALKVEDGAFRAIRPALAAVLARLGVDPGEITGSVVTNSRGEVVGGYLVH